MRFWDASAVVPLLVDEAPSILIREIYRAEPELLVWWATGVECVSALARRERHGELTRPEVEQALALLDRQRQAWAEVDPSEPVRRTAARLLRTHDLRAADALQLAAAVVGSDRAPETLELVTLDDRLAEAAAREGFRVLPALSG